MDFWTDYVPLNRVAFSDTAREVVKESFTKLIAQVEGESLIYCIVAVDEISSSEGIIRKAKDGIFPLLVGLNEIAHVPKERVVNLFGSQCVLDFNKDKDDQINTYFVFAKAEELILKVVPVNMDEIREQR